LFWLIGYLAGKALSKPEKQLHHIITTAAACLNWHMARTVSNNMQPGSQQAIDSTTMSKPEAKVEDYLVAGTAQNVADGRLDG